MSQFLRPDSNITTTNITGGYTLINEDAATWASGGGVSGRLYSANGSNATYECGLSNPGATPNPGTTTVRFAAKKWDSSTTDPAPSSGRSVVLTCHVYQGSTLIASSSPLTMVAGGSGPGNYIESSFTPNMSGVTDWNNLRLRFTSSQTGSGAQWGFALAWAEMEVPDALTFYTMAANGGSFSLTGGTATFPLTRRLDAQGAVFALSGGDAAFIKGKGIGAEGGVFAFSGGDAAFHITRRLDAGGSSYSLTGGDATFRKDYFIIGEGAEFIFAAGDAVFPIREQNGWDIPKHPATQWGQAGSGGSGEWILVDPNFVNWTLQ